MRSMTSRAEGASKLEVDLLRAFIDAVLFHIEAVSNSRQLAMARTLLGAETMCILLHTGVHHKDTSLNGILVLELLKVNLWEP